MVFHVVVVVEGSHPFLSTCRVAARKKNRESPERKSGLVRTQENEEVNGKWRDSQLEERLPFQTADTRETVRGSNGADAITSRWQ